MDITELDEAQRTVVDGLIRLVETETKLAEEKQLGGRSDYMQHWYNAEKGLELAGKLNYFPSNIMVRLKREQGSAVMRAGLLAV
jgi:hypothetical protein